MSIFDRLMSKELKNDVANEASMELDIHEKSEERIEGKIIKVASGDEENQKGGYGFISSRAIPFTRIFFHWSALRPDTLKFTELRTGMKVSFVAFKTEDKGYRAIKIKVED